MNVKQKMTAGSAPKRLTALLVALLATSVLLCAGASSASAVLIGLNESGQGASEQDMEAVRRSGANVYQLGIVWKRIADQGNWKESPAWQQTYDIDIERAARNEVNLVGGLYGRRTEAAIHQYYLSNEWNEWLEFAWTAVQRYGRNGAFWTAHPNLPYRPITSWTVWNEPNLGFNNPGETVLPQKYAEFLIATSSTIKSAQNAIRKAGEPNDTRVIHGGLYQPDGGMAVGTFVEKASKVSGYGGSFDEFGLHPYSFAGNESQKIAGLASNVEQARNALNAWVGSGKPMWLNELGWPIAGSGEPSVSEAEQAKLLTSALDWVKANASKYNIELVTWYFYKDLGGSTWDGYCGLRDQNGRYRESWYAFQKEAGVPLWPVEQTEDSDLPSIHSVAQGNGTIDAFWRTPSGTLGHAWTQGGPWSAGDMPGSLASTSVPHPVIQASGQISIFWRTPSGGLGHAWDDQGGWHTDTLAGSLASDPHAVAQPNGTIDVFYRTPSGELGHNWYQPGGEWHSGTVGGSVASDPYPVVSPSKGWIDVFWRTPSGGLGHAWTQGGTWSVQDISGASIDASSAPHPIEQANGTQDLFWKTPSAGLGHAWLDGYGWHVNLLGGTLASEPHPVQHNGTIDVFYRTPSGGLGHDFYQPGGQWSVETLTNSVASDPYPVMHADGSIDVFWQVPGGGALGHAWDDQNGWHANTLSGSPAAVPLPVIQPDATIDVLYPTTSGGVGHNWYQVGGTWESGAVSGSVALRAPVATTEAATGVKVAQATISGTVNPEGSATSYYFEYGTTTAYGSKTPGSAVALGSGLSGIAVSQGLTGLAEGTTYHYRVVGESPAGVTKGEDKTFTTTTGPEVLSNIVQELSGTPSGWVSIGGNVYGNGVNGAKLNVKLEKWEGSGWVFKESISPQPVVASNYYEVKNKSVSQGRWRTKTVLEAQGALKEAQSEYREFTIGGGYQLVAKHSGKCLNVYGAETKNGATMIQFTCGSLPANNEIFTLVPQGESYYQIIAKHSGKCVEVPGSSQANATQLQQNECLGAGQSNQIWKMVPYGSGSVHLVAKHSSKCMDVYNAEQANLAAIIQYTCGEGTNQQWEMRPVSMRAPKAVSEAATAVKVTQATLNGTVNPEGSATSYYFEYGTTTSYGVKIPTSPQSVGAGLSDIVVNQTPTGLAVGATYHYRMVAESPYGVTKGEDKTFTTTTGPEVLSSIVQALSGTPSGWVSIGGNVYGNGVNGAKLNVQLEKWENSQWVFKETVSPQPIVASNAYEVKNKSVSQGLWRTKTVLPAQGTLKEAQSEYREFTIGSGYQLVARHSGKCLDVYGAETSNGAAMIQYTCNSNIPSDPNQVFTLVPQGESYYQIIAKHSGKCVEVPGSSQANATQLQQNECLGAGQSNQIWKMVPYGSGSVHLVAKHSSKCMDVYNAEQANLAAIVQYTCGEGTNQQWEMRSVP